MHFMTRDRLAAAFLAAVVAASLAFASSAIAVEPGGYRIPKDAPLVAGPTPSGATLLAFDRFRRVCTAFVEPGEVPQSGDSACDLPQVYLHRLREVRLDSFYNPRAEVMDRWGLVEPEVAEVELVLSGGHRVRAATSEGSSYAGRYAGKVRFVLIEASGPLARRKVRYFKLYAADGSLLGVAESHEDAEDPFPQKLDSAVLARGSVRGAGWSLSARRQRILAPLPRNEERLLEETCARVLAPRRVIGGSRLRVGTCIHPDDTRARYTFALDQDCSRIGITGVALVAPEVRALIAVLGNGRVRRLRLWRLPTGYGDWRAAALVLERSTALRRLVAVTGGGHHRLLYGSIGPGAVRCGRGGGFITFDDDVPATPRGPATLTVYDEGVQLCATLGRRTRQPGECQPAPIEAEQTRILTRRAGRAVHVAGVVSPDVTRAVVKLVGGRRIALDTHSYEGYDGRYASSLRFFTVTLEPGQSVVSIPLYNASGGRVYTAEGRGEGRAEGSPRLVVPGPPGLRVRADWFGWPDLAHAGLCLRLGASNCWFGTPFDVQVSAECTPRRLVLWGVLEKGIRSVVVETSRDDVTGRVETLPAPFRDPAKQPSYLRQFDAASAFVVAVPGEATPTALVVRGRRTTRYGLRLPAASAQCGYEDVLDTF